MDFFFIIILLKIVIVENEIYTYTRCNPNKICLQWQQKTVAMTVVRAAVAASASAAAMWKEKNSDYQPANHQ